MSAFLTLAATTLVLVAQRLHFHYRAWRFYVEQNEEALRAMGRPPGGSMGLREYLGDRTSRLIYGAEYAATLKGLDALREPLEPRR